MQDAPRTKRAVRRETARHVRRTETDVRLETIPAVRRETVRRVRPERETGREDLSAAETAMETEDRHVRTVDRDRSTRMRTTAPADRLLMEEEAREGRMDGNPQVLIPSILASRSRDVIPAEKKKIRPRTTAGTISAVQNPEGTAEAGQ